MKNISLFFALQCIVFSIFILDFENVFVVSQGLELSEIVKTMLAQAPVKILSLVQLGLLARLLSQRRNRLSAPGSDGLDNDRDGLIDEDDESEMESQKKNVMVFLGKHNIQVSNHGLKKDEEEEEEEVEGNDEFEEDYEVDGQEYEDYSDDKYIDKYKLYKKVKENKYGYPKGYGGEDRYQKQKKTKTRKKTYKKNIKDSYEDDGEYEYEEEDSPDYKPTLISYANSDIKQTQTLLPLLKKLTKMSDNEKTVKKAVANKDVKDSNIMALPNGFPIGGSKLVTKPKGRPRIRERSDDSSDYSEVDENDLLESEIDYLLSDPEVIEFLLRLNESLVNHTKLEEKNRTKRQSYDNVYQDFTPEEWPHSRSEKRWSIKVLDNNFRPKNVSKYLSRYSRNNNDYYSPEFKSQINSQQSVPLMSSPPINDLKSESSENSIKIQRKESNKIFKKLGDYMSFKPLSHKLKTSSSQSDPSYEMQITDDDQYEGPIKDSNYGQEQSGYTKQEEEYSTQPGKEYISEEKEYGGGGDGALDQYQGKENPYEGKEYGGGPQEYEGKENTYEGKEPEGGGEPQYGYKEPNYGEMSDKMYGRPAGVIGDDNTMAYGGIGTGYTPEEYSGGSPKVPIMDLSYWSKVVKKANKKKYKKKKKKYNKKYTTTEAPEQEEDDDYEQGDYDYEEEGTEEEEPRKAQTTIQIIKAGSRAGNIGINSPEEERYSSSSKSWVKSLPGFRKIFGRR